MMRTRYSVMITCVVFAVLLTAPSSAVIFNGPADAFSIELEGNWIAQEPEPDSLVIFSTDTADNLPAVIFAPAEIDLEKPIDDQLIQEIKSSPDDFPNARDFTTHDRAQVMGQDRVAVSMTFDHPEGQAMMCIGTAFPAGNRWYLAVVIGAVDPEVMQFAWDAFACIGAPSAYAQPLSCQANGAAPIGERGNLPPGWLMRTTNDNRAVQIFEEQQPGALGEMCLLPCENRTASAVLHQAFYMPLADSLQAEEVVKDETDSMAKMAYRRTTQGVALQGEVMVAIAGQDALLAHICAPPEQYEVKAGEVKQLLYGLLGEQTQQAVQAAQAPPPDPAQFNLQPKKNTDGSASLSVPENWVVQGDSGMLMAMGPEGYVVLGGRVNVIDPATAMLPQGAQLPPGMLAAPYMPPDQAVIQIIPQLAQMAGGSVNNIQLISASPMPQGPNWASLELSWTETDRTRNWGKVRVSAVIGTLPSVGMWQFVASYMVAPESTFDQVVPMLTAISMTPQILHRSGGGGGGGGTGYNADSNLDIISDVYRNRSEVNDINAKKWSAYMRGEEAVIDDTTGEARLLGNVQDLNRWMEDDPGLNLNNLRPMNMDDWHTADPE